MLGYFGEDSEFCGYCDLCDKLVEVFDGIMFVCMVLLVVLCIGESYGVGYLIEILLGVMNDCICECGYDVLFIFGVGKEYNCC